MSFRMPSHSLHGGLMAQAGSGCGFGGCLAAFIKKTSLSEFVMFDQELKVGNSVLRRVIPPTEDGVLMHAQNRRQTSLVEAGSAKQLGIAVRVGHTLKLLQNPTK